MGYFNFHARNKKLITEGKLIDYRIVDDYKGISPALLLFFNDNNHPVVPIRQHKFAEYLCLLEKYNNLK